MENYTNEVVSIANYFRNFEADPSQSMQHNRGQSPQEAISFPPIQHIGGDREQEFQFSDPDIFNNYITPEPDSEVESLEDMDFLFISHACKETSNINVDSVDNSTTLCRGNITSSTQSEICSAPLSDNSVTFDTKESISTVCNAEHFASPMVIDLTLPFKLTDTIKYTAEKQAEFVKQQRSVSKSIIVNETKNRLTSTPTPATPVIKQTSTSSSSCAEKTSVEENQDYDLKKTHNRYPRKPADKKFEIITGQTKKFLCIDDNDILSFCQPSSIIKLNSLLNKRLDLELRLNLLKSNNDESKVLQDKVNDEINKCETELVRRRDAAKMNIMIGLKKYLIDIDFKNITERNETFVKRCLDTLASMKKEMSSPYSPKRLSVPNNDYDNVAKKGELPSKVTKTTIGNVTMLTNKFIPVPRKPTVLKCYPSSSSEETVDEEEEERAKPIIKRKLEEPVTVTTTVMTSCGVFEVMEPIGASNNYEKAPFPKKETDSKKEGPTPKKKNKTKISINEKVKCVDKFFVFDESIDRKARSGCVLCSTQRKKCSTRYVLNLSDKHGVLCCMKCIHSLNLFDRDTSEIIRSTLISRVDAKFKMPIAFTLSFSEESNDVRRIWIGNKTMCSENMTLSSYNIKSSDYGKRKAS